MGCGISKMVGPKKQDFCPRINMLKERKIKRFCRWMTVHRKVPKSYFESRFFLLKIVQIFPKKISLENINLGHQLLLKTFFDKFNFKNNLFLKLGRKIVNFLNLSTLSEKLQKKIRCNFCDKWIYLTLTWFFYRIFDSKCNILR